MGLKVTGTNRKTTPPITAERIIQAAERAGVRDQYGTPFRAIWLTWNPRKPCTEHQCVKGFQDAIIRRDPNNSGIVVKIRDVGSATFNRDQLDGTYRAVIPMTPRNMKALAASYYDEMYSIEDRLIAKEVKKMADQRDLELQSIEVEIEIEEKVIDPITNKTNLQKRKEKTNMLEVEKRRRKNNFTSYHGGDIVSVNRMDQPQEAAALKEVLQERDIDRQLDEIAQQKEDVVQKEMELIDAGYSNAKYPSEMLKKLAVRELTPIAKEFNIICFQKTRKDIVNEILVAQGMRPTATEDVSG
jgi:hypothetical protein